MSSNDLYTCINSFKAGNGIWFNYGQTVSSEIIMKLPLKERQNFKQKEDNYSRPAEESVPVSSIPSFDPFQNNDPTPAYDPGPSSDPAPSSYESDSSSSFGGFDGGDSGGGGSTGDW